MFVDKLKAAVNEWLANEDLDEWYFERFRDENCRSLSPEEAFESISEATRVLLSQTDESALMELAEIILCLTRVSGTTEIPPTLESNKERVEALFLDKCEYAKRKLKEIFAYYRIE